MLESRNRLLTVVIIFPMLDSISDSVKWLKQMINFENASWMLIFPSSTYHLYICQQLIVFPSGCDNKEGKNSK